MNSIIATIALLCGPQNAVTVTSVNSFGVSNVSSPAKDCQKKLIRCLDKAKKAKVLWCISIDEKGMPNPSRWSGTKCPAGMFESWGAAGSFSEDDKETALANCVLGMK